MTNTTTCGPKACSTDGPLPALYRARDNQDTAANLVLLADRIEETLGLSFPTPMTPGNCPAPLRHGVLGALEDCRDSLTSLRLRMEHIARAVGVE